MAKTFIHPASFRDPAGFVFESDGKLYRQVNKQYAEDYDLLINSGLYNELVTKKQLVPHTETVNIVAREHDWYKTLEPANVQFISYPSEWCFSQLKDAALATLSIARTAIGHGMILKDATPFNIQFVNGVATHIDTLSFERYAENQPWIAYSQFCRNFLFPLYISHFTGTPVNRLMSAFPEGIPVSIAARLLPLKSRLNAGVWLHVHLQNHVSNAKQSEWKGEFSRNKLNNVLTGLSNSVEALKGNDESSGWSNYYEPATTPGNYLGEKERVFVRMIEHIPKGTALDLGCNEGRFSMLLSDRGHHVIAVDSDHASIGRLYRKIKAHPASLLPLVVDIMNPTPSSGFENFERTSFLERMKPDIVVALALVHHLTIGSNLPLPRLASFFSRIAPVLLIEWIPREDEKVQHMLSSRHLEFGDYTEDHFENAFSQHFTLDEKVEAGSSGRYIYLMKKR